MKSGKYIALAVALIMLFTLIPAFAPLKGFFACDVEDVGHGNALRSVRGRVVSTHQCRPQLNTVQVFRAPTSTHIKKFPRSQKSEELFAISGYSTRPNTRLTCKV